jgi:hypothetical protein
VDLNVIIVTELSREQRAARTGNPTTHSSSLVSLRMLTQSAQDKS